MSGSGPPRATIAATATVLPPHAVDHEEVKAYLGRAFPLEGARLDAMKAVVDHSRIRRRYFVNPLDDIVRARPLARISEEYRDHSIALGRQVASRCLEQAKVRPDEIDLVVTVSCTGVMIPSLDAHLANDLGFRPDVRRLPITELGCAAGAAAMAHAFEFLRGFEGGTVLVLAVEIPSLTFQRRDLSQANLISSVLFGDGAAAAVVTGRVRRGPEILDAGSHLFPRSIRAMGFDLAEDGFHIVLSRDVPDMIREKIREIVLRFLARNDLTLGDVGAAVLHPGGEKLLRYVEEELGLPREATEPSWRVLEQYGNLSSASVLFVLHEWMTGPGLPAGTHGLMAAFGPGFTAEQVLLRWS